MDVALIVATLCVVYIASIYNRLQHLLLVVQERKANVEAGALGRTELLERLADGSGRAPEYHQMLAQLAGAEQDLLARRESCNAEIRAYNAYRAQIPQILLSRIAGFRRIDFLVPDRTLSAGRPRTEDGTSATVTPMRR
ncbi:LemA family protein [Skermanella mucosa]|uniref:LemA family protein n=1 Tax=Skermanella mucosa TaxID=1789672 RepID=UPI00192B59F3|nr:LemA family protein [Skermanella mucosa]UEM23370.1 LemA family protein [Skermanella mucosa]